MHENANQAANKSQITTDSAYFKSHSEINLSLKVMILALSTCALKMLTLYRLYQKIG